MIKVRTGLYARFALRAKR